MKLEALVRSLPVMKSTGKLDREVTGLEPDSRKVESGNVFIAVSGTAADGHDYIEAAIEKGAAAVVCENMPEKPAPGICYVQVPDSAEALGRLASAWYGDPSAELILTGVTGTNGKTTIATLLYELFRFFGEKTGLLSTVCNYIDERPVPATHTTPDPVMLNRLLREMVDAGCRYAFMEVSSHAVDQRRIAGLTFAGGIFTNLTRDHLDYHKTVDAYLKAKKRFFDELPEGAFALTNADDKTGAVMLQNTRANRYAYSLRTLAEFKGRIIESHLDGTLLEINGREIFVRFAGKFNAYNLLAVFGCACLLGREPDEILVQMSRLVPVAGRFQTLRSPAGITAIIDYAHTPDALTNVLETVREVIGKRRQLITVVGAGGNRDKGKRPIMAHEAIRYSDRLVLTSDNPRFENPDEIIRDMVAGLDSEERQKTLVISDRREAIRAACMLSQPGDVILIAGKGHENYQEIKGIKHHFDDKEEVEALFC